VPPIPTQYLGQTANIFVVPVCKMSFHLGKVLLQTGKLFLLLIILNLKVILADLRNKNGMLPKSHAALA